MSQRQLDLTALPNEPVEIRLYHAHKGTDPDVLKVLSRDTFWFVRDYVASNLNTPRECLQELTNDPDFRIRTEAERTLRKLEKPSLDSRIQSATKASSIRSTDGKALQFDSR